MLTLKFQKFKRSVYKGFRLIASVAILLFMFVEELVLKPLRKLQIVAIEKTIKKMNGYWTIGTLVFIKTIEGLCKVVLPFAPNATVVFYIVLLDGVLGFVSLQLIVHGHDNLKDFHWYHRVVRWIGKIKDDVKATKVYIWAHDHAVEIKEWARELWRDLMFKIFGKRNPKGLVRYVKTAVRLRNHKRRA